MNAQISFISGTFGLIHIPLSLYSVLLQPILRVLLPHTQALQQQRDDAAAASDDYGLEDGLLTVDDQHGFLNISVTPIECSIVCHSSWVKNVFEPAIRRLPRDAQRSVTVSRDRYLVLSVISAGMDAAGRVMELTSPLALAGVPIFFITTYYSDFILVPSKDRQAVVQALLARGFELAENESNFVSPGAALHSRATSQSSSSPPPPPSTPPPSTVAELQTRTFELLKKRNVIPYIDADLNLVQCSGREVRRGGGAADYGRPTISRHASNGGNHSSSGGGGGHHRRLRGEGWLDKVDTKLYTSMVSALVSQPRFLSITLAQDDPPSLLLDRDLLRVFGDALVGDTEGRLVPIFLDLANLPLEATGIVCGVAGKLVQEMRMADNADLSYLSTARAGAVILACEQSVRALEILKPLMVKES